MTSLMGRWHGDRSTLNYQTDAPTESSLSQRAEQTMQRIAKPAIRPGSLFDLLYTRTDETERIIRIVERDPVLTARLLSVTNSAAMGVAIEITSVRRAVHLLGASRTRTIGLAQGLRLLYDTTNLPRQLRDAFWTGSITKACAATMFMAHTAGELAEYAFANALIQDIGLPMLAHVEPDWYAVA